MKAGFGNFFIAVAITATGYICLCCCLAELTGKLPFSGGAYGYARVTVNIYGGYIVGCCEVLEYILYVASSVYVFGRFISAILNLPHIYEPIYWFLFYVIATCLQICDGRLFWHVNTILAVISIVILLLYCVACIPVMNFSQNAQLDDSSNPWFGGKPGYSFMRVLPLASWFYIGIEAVPLAGVETRSVCILVLCILVLLCIFCS